MPFDSRTVSARYILHKSTLLIAVIHLGERYLLKAAAPNSAIYRSRDQIRAASGLHNRFAALYKPWLMDVRDSLYLLFSLFLFFLLFFLRLLKEHSQCYGQKQKQHKRACDNPHMVGNKGKDCAYMSDVVIDDVWGLGNGTVSGVILTNASVGASITE